MTEASRAALHPRLPSKGVKRILSVPFGSGEKAADPERTTTPVEETFSRALIVGAVLAVFVGLVIMAVIAVAGRVTG